MDDPQDDDLYNLETQVQKYRTSRTGMGESMLNEMVKSYGLRRGEDGTWSWSLDNIAQAFKDNPIWTTLDYATLAFEPAKFGIAAAEIAHGAELGGRVAARAAEHAGAFGKAYRALRDTTGTAEQLETASTILGGAEPTTKLGRAFSAFGMSPELVAATEKKLESGASSALALRLPFSQRMVSLGNPIGVNLSDDYIKLIDKFGGEVWENKAVLKVADREKLIAQAKVARDAEVLAGQIGNAQMDEATSQRFVQLLGERVTPDQLDSVVTREFGENTEAGMAYKNTWGFRNTIHEKAYQLGMISKETYEANLYKYNPRIYEEWLQIQADRKTLGRAGTSIPGKFAEDAGTVSADETGHQVETRIVDSGRANFRKSSEPGFEPEHLTRVLDPTTTLTSLARAGQEIAKQEFAQGIARSVIAAEPGEMAEKALEAMLSGDARRKLLLGITAEKEPAIKRLISNLKATGREMTGEQILEELGWKNINVLYGGRDMPAYLKALPDELKNKWLDPHVAEEVFGTLKLMGDDKDLYSKLYKNIVSTFRASKTAYNPATHVRNFLGGGIFATLASGDIRSFIPLRGLKLFREGGEELEAAAKAGVFGSSFSLEFKSQVAKEANLSAKTAIDWMPDNVVTKYVKQGAAAAEGFYRTTDDVYKLDAWVRAVDRYKGMGHDLEQARNLATIDVNKFMPNFMQHSGLVDTVRKGVPFASFTAESIRVWKNVLSEKPHMAYFYNHFAKTASEVFGAMAGYSPDQIEEATNALPSYLQGKKTLLLPFNVDGKPSFIDLSYVIPMGSISEMESSERLFFNAVLDPTTNPIVNLGAAAATGKDPFTGRELAPNFTERQLGIPVTGERTRKLLGLGEHMLQTLLPPLAPFGYAGTNIMEAVRGQINPSTGEKLEDGVFRSVLANVAGLRTYAPTVEAQVKNVKEEQRQIGELTGQAWNRWEFARANGDISGMEEERKRIIALKTREGHDDPEKYFATSEKQRGPFDNLSTKQLQAILDRADKLGPLSPRDERVRAELLARYQSRTTKKPKKD